MLLAVGLLVATWLVDTGLDLSNAAYPAPSVAALLTVWVVTVLPGVVLLGGASFALGTLWPRRATMLKLAVLIIWVALFAVDTTHFPTWFAYWNPTSTSLAAASEQQMVQTFQLHGQTLAAAQEGQTHLPDLQPWLLPHVGLVGPNGAGKTTLMRILATLVPPSSGKAHWNGKDMRTEGQAVRRVLGYLPQEFGVYPEFSGRQFLRYLAGMKGLPADLARRRTDEVLELVNLEDAANRKLGSYSGGMKQ
ncbi:MAG: ATP-binding cassette domain-containing protein, partial [Chloroflexota bacterium]